ncbi:MAG TPA: cupin domain-containing protein [Solirubrobacteraceae bacterium]
MNRVVSLTAPELEFEPDAPERFRSGSVSLGDLFGSTVTGTTFYELPPGQAICPYHFEYTEEEWLLVLEGRPTLRTPEGRGPLAPLDVAFFPKGPEGAHQVINETEERVRVLMWANRVDLGAVVYPDSDKLTLYTGVKGEQWRIRRSAPSLGYYDGEV